MIKLLRNFTNYFVDDNDSPYIRFAETEYTMEFRMLTKTLGRRPNEDEAKSLVLRYR